MIAWRIRVTAPIEADGWLILSDDLIDIGVYDDAGVPIGGNVDYHTTDSGDDPWTGVLPQPDWVAGIGDA